MEFVAVDPRDTALSAERLEVEPMEHVEDKLRFISVKIANEKSRIQWPEWLLKKKHFPDRAVAPGDYARALHHRQGVKVRDARRTNQRHGAG
jgi:hypothetical protein